MCLFCGTPLPDTKIGFRDLCDTCGREMHICRHCVFYKPGVFRDCTETIPEAITDKDRMNFCDFFKANPKTVKNSAAMDASNAAKNAFDGLFNG